MKIKKLNKNIKKYLPYSEKSVNINSRKRLREVELLVKTVKSSVFMVIDESFLVIVNNSLNESSYIWNFVANEIN